MTLLALALEKAKAMRSVSGAFDARKLNYTIGFCEITRKALHNTGESSIELSDEIKRLKWMLVTTDLAKSLEEIDQYKLGCEAAHAASTNRRLA